MSTLSRHELAQTLRRYRSINAPFRMYEPAHAHLLQEARRLRLPVLLATSQLAAKVLRANGMVESYGVLSRRMITTVGVQFMVDAHQNLTELEAINFHGMGTGAGAEAVGDTTITQVESRVAGTQSEPTATQYRTVATITATAVRAVTEHGLFSASTAGTLFDRSVFTVINLAINDSIQFTYTLSYTAGG